MNSNAMQNRESVGNILAVATLAADVAMLLTADIDVDALCYSSSCLRAQHIALSSVF